MCNLCCVQRLSCVQMDLYFYDSALMPLFVQENYLVNRHRASQACSTRHAVPAHAATTRTRLSSQPGRFGGDDLTRLRKISEAADSIAFSDVVGTSIME
jgi:hypothetical protein